MADDDKVAPLSSHSSGSAKNSALRKSLEGPDAGRSLNRRVSFQAGREDEHAASPARSKKGQEVAMKKIVDQLYHKVLADERLAGFYEGINMVRLKNQQEKLMILVFGGEDLLKEMAPDLDLRKIHIRAIAKQGLNTEHWRYFVDHFMETMEEMTEIPADSKEKASVVMEKTRDWFRPIEPAELEAYNKAHPEDSLSPTPGVCPHHH